MGDRGGVCRGDGQRVAGGEGEGRLALGALDGLVAEGHGVLDLGVLGAVVGPLAVGGLDLELGGALLDLEGADGRGDLVVALGHVAPCDLVLVLGGADLGLGAGDGDLDRLGAGQGDGGSLARGQRGVGAAEGRGAVSGQRVAVVLLVGGPGRDRDLGGGDLQLAISRGHEVVADRSGGARGDGNAVDGGNHVLDSALCDMRNRAVLGHHDGEGVGVALLQIGRGEAALSQREAVIGLLIGVGGDGDSLRVDGQRTNVGNDALVVARGVGSAISDRVGIGVVVARVVGDVGHARGGRGDGHHVAIGELKDHAGRIGSNRFAAVRDGVGLILVERSVVGPPVRRRRDDERALVLRNRQRAVGGGHHVVADRSGGAGSDGNAVDRGNHVGLLADVGDGGVPGHHDGEGVGVALLQIGRDEAVLGQRRAVVGLRCVIGGNGDLLRVDGQVALNVDDVVVVGRSADNGVGRNDLVGVGAGVGLAARERDARERVGALEALDGHIGVEAGGVVTGRTLRAAVVSVGLVLGRDGQGRLGDGELTRDNFGDDIVASGVLRLVDGNSREGHAVLTDVGAGAGSGDTGEGKALNRAGEARDGLLCTVVGLAFGGGGQGDGNGIDGELAGNQGTKRVELGNIFTVGISDRERLCKRTVGVYASIGALGGGVLDAQSMAICKTRDRILSVTALLSTIVGNLLVSHGDVERRLGHLKGTEVLDDVIIACLSIVPRNRIGVIRGSRLGNGSVCCEGYRLALDKAGDGRLVLGEGGAVVCLGVRTRGDGCVLRVNLQAARTDVDAHAVVRIIRKVCLRQRDVIGVVACILLCNQHVAKACGASLDSLGVNLCPNLIKILVPIALVTDHHVVGNALGGIGKASLLDGAVIDVASPAVRLDANGDVDPGHLERAADVAERVVVVGVRRVGLCIPGRYGRSTRVDATIVGRVVGIGVGESDACQALALGQALNNHLGVKSLGQSQCGAIILLAVTRSGDSDLLLIVDGELEATCSNSLGYLVGVARLFSAEARSLDCRVELPTRNGRTAQSEGLTNLKVLGVGGSNVVAVHVHVVHGHGRVLVAGVVERKDVCLFICSQDQRLLDRIRIKLDVFKLRVGCT